MLDVDENKLDQTADNIWAVFLLLAKWAPVVFGVLAAGYVYYGTLFVKSDPFEALLWSVPLSLPYIVWWAYNRRSSD